MKTRFIMSSALFLCMIIFFIRCSDDKGVKLTVDFSSRESWYYNFKSAIGGEVSFRDSGQSFSSEIECLLHGEGKKDNPLFITLYAESVKVRSDYLSDPEVEDLKRGVRNEIVHYSLKRGFEDNNIGRHLSLSHGRKWNLLKHGFKVLPVLPQNPVSEGDVWERATDIPVDTPHGEAVGHLYQSFVFDSLTEKGEAYISWIFNYSVENFSDDTAGLLDDLPGKGHGNGNAVLDLKSKALNFAQVEFSVVQDITNGIVVVWNEKASFKLRKETGL